MKAKLLDAGFSDKEIKFLTSKTNWKNNFFIVSGDGYTYVDTSMLETVVLDMLANGYTLREIEHMLTMSDRWYDLNTHQVIRTAADMERRFLDEAFLVQYELVPQYIRYNSDLYKELMDRYKALGFSTADAWRVMRTDYPYINAYGEVAYLTDEQRRDYEKYMELDYFKGQEDDGFLEWYNTLPEYIRYEKGAYSRTLAYLKQMFTDEEAKQMIANGAYYSIEGKLLNCKDLKRAPRFSKSNKAFQDANGYWHKEGDFQDANGYWYHKGDNPYLGLGSFEAYWNTLPDYLRYTKGAWSTTNKVLKQAGFDYNTRMKLLQDGILAVQIDPNSAEFQTLLAQQDTKVVYNTVTVEQEVPLRECSWNGTEWVWNGPQSVKVTDFGNGYTVEEVQKTNEYYAASLGAKRDKVKDYGSAMVKVKVNKIVAQTVNDEGQVVGRIVTMNDGTTYYLTDKLPEYHRPRGNYYNRNYVKREWDNSKKSYRYAKRPYINKKYNRYFRHRKGYPITGNGYYFSYAPMHIKYSNVRTYSKTHFLYQQGLGYQYWMQWGDGRITNHVNRNGRRTLAPSTYRNPIAKSRNMYKELYGKYGASRMNQRQNIKSYSNGSVTRLRRNDLRNRAYNIRQAQLRVK